MQAGERDEQLDSIARNTRRMARMMEDILVLSRLEAGKLEFQPAALDLNAFCSRVVEDVLSPSNHRCCQIADRHAVHRRNREQVGGYSRSLCSSTRHMAAPSVAPQSFLSVSCFWHKRARRASRRR